jgi:hypothetical protein
MKLLAPVTLMLLFIGCADTQPATDSTSKPTTGNLLFKDAAGNVVATGELKLPDPLPPAGQSFEGKWKLISSDKSFPAHAVNDKYIANISDQGLWIDLSAGVRDNNIVLKSTPESGFRQGKWYHTTFVGENLKGTFEIAK